MGTAKVKSGALQFVVFVGALIAILLSALILLIHVQDFFVKQGNRTIEVVKAADYGIQYVLHHDIALNDSITLDLGVQKNGYRNLTVQKSYWGLFQKVVSISNDRKKTFKKIALVGGKYKDDERPALYLTDKNNPLLLVGNTHIQGSVFLPHAGVQGGNINGTPYFGNQLVNGSINSSKSELPRLVQEMQEQLIDLKENFFSLSGTTTLSSQFPLEQINSFSNNTIVVESDQAITLGASKIIGNIVIQSATKIIVGSETQLKDVLLLAPIIEIQDKAKGSFQAFATETLTVGSNCNLSYPTVLMVNPKNNNAPIAVQSGEISSPLTIKDQSVINGLVAYLGGINPQDYTPQINLGILTTVNGEVYCQGNLDLKGTVNGSVFAEGFMASQFGSVYQNHLYNAQILGEGLPQQFIGILMEEKQKEVAKWLY